MSMNMNCTCIISRRNKNNNNNKNYGKTANHENINIGEPLTKLLILLKDFRNLRKTLVGNASKLIMVV
jgi:hypothetical protein